MLDKIKQAQHARQLSGEIPIYHRYTLGVAGEEFFKAMRDQRQLLASPCPKCHDRLLPPKMYCERCFEETSGDWQTVDGPGYVRSFTVLHYSLDEEPLDIPVVVALVGWPGVQGRDNSSARGDRPGSGNPGHEGGGGMGRRPGGSPVRHQPLPPGPIKLNPWGNWGHCLSQAGARSW